MTIPVIMSGHYQWTFDINYLGNLVVDSLVGCDNFSYDASNPRTRFSLWRERGGERRNFSNCCSSNNLNRTITSSYSPTVA